MRRGAKSLSQAPPRAPRPWPALPPCGSRRHCAATSPRRASRCQRRSRGRPSPWRWLGPTSWAWHAQAVGRRCPTCCPASFGTSTLGHPGRRSSWWRGPLESLSSKQPLLRRRSWQAWAARPPRWGSGAAPRAGSSGGSSPPGPRWWWRRPAGCSTLPARRRGCWSWRACKSSCSTRGTGCSRRVSGTCWRPSRCAPHLCGRPCSSPRHGLSPSGAPRGSSARACPPSCAWASRSSRSTRTSSRRSRSSGTRARRSARCGSAAASTSSSARR
mmetsp:Transcript_17894/g.53948  ORF Transcript_17894/g.53948 Transcript_17894/m.53948 type:complete len:272 (-) Transcript_17894:799-1614(-)